MIFLCKGQYRKEKKNKPLISGHPKTLLCITRIKELKSEEGNGALVVFIALF